MRTFTANRPSATRCSSLRAQSSLPYFFSAVSLPNSWLLPDTPPRIWRHGSVLPSGWEESPACWARISLLVAFAGTLISCTLGTTLGFLAAHKKGWVDEFIMMLIDFQASMPFVLIALAILAFLGNSLGLFIAVMGLNGWERFARFTRGLARSASARGYVNAVRVMGASPLRIYFPSTVLLESSLSFLGLGIQPPLTSLGAMLGEGRNYLINAWWISVAPGAVIFCVTLSACILGDWLRDRLDPTLR